MSEIVIVQHQPSVPPGLIGEVLRTERLPHRILRAWEETEWPNPSEVSALVVLGGTMNVDEVERYPFLGRSRSLMAACLEASVPTLGVCLGSQMMARVLGAPVRRAPSRSALFAPLEFRSDGADDPVVGAFTSRVPVLQFHEDTFTFPSEAVPLAVSAATGLGQAFRYGDDAYGVQFHFEVDRAIVRGWCDAIGDESLSSDWGTTTAAIMREVEAHVEDQRRAGSRLLRAFLRRLERI